MIMAWLGDLPQLYRIINDLQRCKMSDEAHYNILMNLSLLWILSVSVLPMNRTQALLS